jgi:hypothetical protein
MAGRDAYPVLYRNDAAGAAGLLAGAVIVSVTISSLNGLGVGPFLACEGTRLRHRQ